MNLLLPILLKITPLYLYILLGFVAGRFLQTPRDAIARIMFFLINPLVIFNGILRTQLHANILALPFITMAISILLCMLFYKISKGMWKDGTGNLLAFSAGTGNMGYFGLPLALLLFNEQEEGVYMMGLLGVSLYEGSLGYYIFAKGTHTSLESLKRLLRLPILYAFLLAFILNISGFSAPALFTEFMCHIKGAYAVLGMMLIGIGFSSLHDFVFDRKFVILSCVAKFIAWPGIVLIFIGMDAWLLGLYSTGIHRVMLLLAIVPMAVNTVVIASVLHVQPEKAALGVVLTTLIAVIYVPLMILYFIHPWPFFPFCP
jgi:predicted permease